MTSPHDPVRIHAFIDGEQDLASRLDTEARLAADPDLREQADSLRELRDVVRERADYHAAPEALRQRVAALAAGGAPAREPLPARRAPALSPAAVLQRWFGWRPLAGSVALAAVMTLALNVALQRGAQDDRLLDEVVAGHVRSTMGEHLVDVASSNHHTVKPWLSARLDFSPPVHELPLPGSAFVGGRVDYLDGRPVAALVYRQGEHVVNTFVWRDAAGDSAPRFATRRGYHAAHWSRGGMAHWVISDLDAQEFRKVVAAIAATADER